MDEMILAAVCNQQDLGSPAALITIISTRGSTPRKAGSKMLVLPDGRTVGTIGGGCAEAEAKMKALTAMDGKGSHMHTISMLDDAAEEEGMVCGGVMDIFIQVV